MVLRVAELYQKFRRAYIADSYYALPKAGDPSASRNWRHFERAAAYLREQGASEKEWIAAQFVGCTKAAYPRPTELYCKSAERKWKEYQDMRQDWGVAVKEQEEYRDYYSKIWKLEPSLVVLMSHIFPFRPWFAAVTADVDDLPLDIVEDAREELRIGGLSKALVEAGYDVGEVKSQLDVRLAGDYEV